MHPFVLALLGGCLIGAATSLLHHTTGHIAGISGITDGLVPPTRGDAAWRVAFLGALVVAGALVQPFFPAGAVRGSPALVALAGVLVGYGTRLGGGCTSGHGICGVARGRRRSIVATATFMAAGMITVAVARWL